MKTLSISTILLFLTACSEKENKTITPKEKSYTLRVETSEHSAVKRYEDKIRKYEIRAKSDSEAYEKGITTFASWQKAYDTVKTIYLWKSETFSVRDEDENDVVKVLNESTRQTIQNKFNTGSLTKDDFNSEKINQRPIAFENWRFGKSLKNYPKEENVLKRLGKEMYFFKPFANDSLGLYRIILEGLETNAKSFDTKVKKSVENLYNVFSLQHGPGKKTNSFPSNKNLSRGYTKWLYEWNVGNKNIKIGIGALLNGIEYYSVCWITDTELAAAHHAIMRNRVK